MDNFKTVALIGYTGFVGSNLNLKYDFTHKYNSKNINDIIGKTFDCVICAGISATKWWANTHPDEDLYNINNLLNILLSVNTKKFILISTIDVYHDINDGDENTIICPENNHAYGKNRYYVETFIKKTFPDYVIIRLPGLFGYGLKKNIIYDYLNCNLKELNVNSSFQWYNISNLYGDIIKILNMNVNVNMNVKTVNLFTEPIYNEDLHHLFCFYDKNCTYMITNTNTINYNIKTCYGNDKYWDTKENVLKMLGNYIDNMLNSKLTISNLSWKHNGDKEMLQKLDIFGIKCLEVSPYKYFNGGNVNMIQKIDIYSFQAILYPHTFNIFSDPDIVIEYLSDLMYLAKSLGVKVLVFGSPKNRHKGELTYESAMNLAVDFFTKLGNIAKKNGVVIAIEPNAKCYGCDFIVNSVEGRELVMKVNSPNFKLHLDIGCMFLENENIMECITNNLDILEHIHFSAPELKSLLTNDKLNYNELFYNIKQIYKKMISIEMLGQDDLVVFRNVGYVLG
jgi:sugar phosphate isomerase/epimerase